MFPTKIIILFTEFTYVSWRKVLEITQASLCVFVCVCVCVCVCVFPFPGNGLQKVTEMLSGLKSHLQIQDRQCTYSVALRRIRAFIDAVEKKIITYSECVFVALGIQYAVRIRHIVICRMTGSNIFSTLCRKRQDFRKRENKFIGHKMCFDFQYNI